MCQAVSQLSVATVMLHHKQPLNLSARSIYCLRIWSQSEAVSVSFLIVMELSRCLEVSWRLSGAQVHASLVLPPASRSAFAWQCEHATEPAGTSEFSWDLGSKLAPGYFRFTWFSQTGRRVCGGICFVFKGDAVKSCDKGHGYGEGGD